MVRLILRTCQQCGFEQSEYIHKTVDVTLPEVEKLMERPGDGFAVVGAHLIAPQNTAELAATDSQQLKQAIALLKRASSALCKADFDKVEFADLVQEIDEFSGTACI